MGSVNLNPMVRPRPFCPSAVSRGTTARRCVVAVAVAWIVAAHSLAAQPRVVFTQLQHAAGVVYDGTKVAHVFPVANVGDEPLHILSAEASCGCTEAFIVGGDVIPAGGSGAIRVVTDTTGKRGRFTKEIDVTTDDPGQPVTTLTLTGRVVKDVVAHRGQDLQGVIFDERCGRCHAEPAAGRRGEDLYDAVCAFCHGERGHGGGAPALKRLSYLRRVNADGLRTIIGSGRPEDGMPGFHRSVGGPLDDDQISSLVAMMFAWRDVFEAAVSR
jgi:cytochrome c553